MARWVNKMRWLIGGLGAVASLTATSSVQAQDGALTELYGYAVHRFYAGDYNEAQRALNIVIDAGVEDPRPHYFRGLVTYQMGMQDAAKSDFDHAAELEARGKAVVSISQALQRIQGPVRRDIELSRLMARVAVAQEQRAKKQMESLDSQASPNVAKPPAGNENALPPVVSGDAPAAEPTTPATPPATVPTPPSTPDMQNDPFKDDAAVPPPATPATPTDPAADPFGAAPATPPAPTPAADDPFK